jgi:hypothetical protein
MITSEAVWQYVFTELSPAFIQLQFPVLLFVSTVVMTGDAILKH